MNAQKSKQVSQEDAGNQTNKSTDKAVSENSAAVVVHSQGLKDLSLEVPNSLATLGPNAKQPAVSVAVDVNGRKLNKEEAIYETTVDFKIRAQTEDENGNELVCFILELSYGTILKLGDAIPKDRHDFAALIEGGVLGFPFARAIIANTVQDAGFPTIYLTPINFVELVQMKANRAAQEKEKQKQS